jgi:hypothetical protein
MISGNTARSPKKGTVADLLNPVQPATMVNLRKAMQSAGGLTMGNRDLQKLSRGGSQAGTSQIAKSLAGKSGISQGTYAKSRRSKAETEVNYEEMDILSLEAQISAC